MSDAEERFFELLGDRIRKMHSEITEIREAVRHLHERFDYLAGQVEILTKGETGRQMQDTAHRIEMTAINLQTIPSNIGALNRRFSALVFEMECARETRRENRIARQRRKAGLPVLESLEDDHLSPWESLHREPESSP